MLPEPFNALLWHAARIHNFCSIEIATTGSVLYANLRTALPNDDLVLLGHSYPESLVVLALSENRCFRISKSSSHHFEQISTNESLPHERYTIKELIRHFTSEIIEITSKLQDSNLDLARLGPVESTTDNSIDMLNAFDHRGLTKLFQIANLKVTLDYLIDTTPPLSVTTAKKTTDFLFTTRVLCNNYLRLLTNALIYDLHQRVDSEVTR